MRTILLLLLLAPCAAAAQNFEPTPLRPSEIDPNAVYIFQWCKGQYVSHLGCAAKAYFIVEATGKWVSIPIACEECANLCKEDPVHMELPPFSPKSL